MYGCLFNDRPAAPTVSKSRNGFCLQDCSAVGTGLDFLTCGRTGGFARFLPGSLPVCTNCRLDFKPLFFGIGVCIGVLAAADDSVAVDGVKSRVTDGGDTVR